MYKSLRECGLKGASTSAISYHSCDNLLIKLSMYVCVYMREHGVSRLPVKINKLNTHKKNYTLGIQIAKLLYPGGYIAWIYSYLDNVMQQQCYRQKNREDKNLASICSLAP